jgi:hypothetical protein
MKKIMRQYRQGDVLLIEIEQPSRTGKPIDPQDTRVVLARGELSGHAHVIQNSNGQAHLFEGPGDRRYLLMTETGRLQHEEHLAIVLECGWYEVRRQRQYDPAGPTLTGD